MHLKQLKLAGFKSFVDPTVIPFPSQLLAILGPNGCGKSNIIDAVRWVLGESSAKTLRGESMADVIFNGSSNRKPVGQAQVELVFDNSFGRVTGQFARFQEISIKRVVTRAGDSAYYLNGTRCRRRDITDLFLGTGAGAQGYSIIGQGTISKLIEARPEELRSYFEEAAGVSKYKERRRETLQRMHTTEEHLTRVHDIRSELDKQLERLSKQAKTAERFVALKEAERHGRALICVLKWRDLSATLTDKKNTLRLLRSNYEQHQNEHAVLDAMIVAKQQALYHANTQLAEQQTTYYQIGTDIARIEQELLQKTREHERLTKECEQLKNDYLMLDAHLTEQRSLLLTCEQELEQHSQNRHIFEQALLAQEQRVAGYLQAEQVWDEDWRSLQLLLNQLRREIDIQALQLQHYLTERQQLVLRLEKIDLALDEHALEDLNQLIKKSKDETADNLHDLELANQRVEQLSKQQSQASALYAETSQQVHQNQDRLAQLKVDCAALQASLNAACKFNTAELASDWQHKAKVFESIEVDQAWRPACELVLGIGLHAIIVDSLEDLWDSIQTQQKNIVFTVAHQAVKNTARYPTLLDKITKCCPSWASSLETVFAADDLKMALSWLPTLKAHESIVTPDGLWLGLGWLIVSREKDDKTDSLLEQQAQFLIRSEALLNAEHALAQAIVARDEAHQKLQMLNDALLQAKAVSEECLSAYRQSQLLCDEYIRQQEQLAGKHQELALEAAGIQSRLEVLVEEQLKLSEAHEKNSQAECGYKVKEQALLDDKKSWSSQLAHAQTDLDLCRKELHACELVLTQHRQQQQHYLANRVRDEEQLALLQERLEQLALLLHADNGSDVSLQHNLALKCEMHAKLDEALHLARATIQNLESELAESLHDLREFERKVKSEQEHMQQLLMEEQALIFRVDAQLNALTELGFSLSSFDATVLEYADLAQKEEELVEIAEKIKRLGAINLLAIEEYETELNRKQQLDMQYDDLTNALQTLEKAIAQMDKETSLRLQQTFDEVNLAFQKLFPRLFGGGHARLLLTCDNLLEAGVLVMAQPPGKRNSSIQLLSGGEKAMTAVALVFAIFQQNPSPFCMLDEVDAPLDEANVGRFCDLVKEMSQAVQFLFITHNKATMMLAEHLIGVTMREPGVSRVVAVDIEQALSIGE